MLTTSGENRVAEEHTFVGGPLTFSKYGIGVIAFGGEALSAETGKAALLLCEAINSLRMYQCSDIKKMFSHSYKI